MEKILTLAPDTDDGEIGCGGTIAKFIENGSNVFYAAFSSAGEYLLAKYEENGQLFLSIDSYYQYKPKKIFNLNKNNLTKKLDEVVWDTFTEIKLLSNK